MLIVSNGKIVINGKETTNPELIGWYLLDLAEQGIEITTLQKIA